MPFSHWIHETNFLFLCTTFIYALATKYTLSPSLIYYNIVSIPFLRHRFFHFEAHDRILLYEVEFVWIMNLWCIRHFKGLVVVLSVLMCDPTQIGIVSGDTDGIGDKFVIFAMTSDLTG